ncbi:hypothetical protein WP12_08225 [Sphingomonas sp. SRS2]|nr:hypothetical protein WP12_08225 [Sphingomonas sp. SRS2]
MSLSHFRHPFDIGRHPSFEPEVQRAILASWASDAATLKHDPHLRSSPPKGSASPVSDARSALKSLDRYMEGR